MAEPEPTRPPGPESPARATAGPAAADLRPDTCPRCGTRFACGLGTGGCWCASLPALAPLPSGLPAACLCPACLGELARRAARPGAGGP